MAAWQGHPPSHQEVCDNGKEFNRIPGHKFSLLTDGCQGKYVTLWYKNIRLKSLQTQATHRKIK
jgi:hypothetical protein